MIEEMIPPPMSDSSGHDHDPLLDNNHQDPQFETHTVNHDDADDSVAASVEWDENEELPFAISDSVGTQHSPPLINASLCHSSSPSSSSFMSLLPRHDPNNTTHTIHQSSTTNTTTTMSQFLETAASLYNSSLLHNHDNSFTALLLPPSQKQKQKCHNHNNTANRNTQSVMYAASTEETEWTRETLLMSSSSTSSSNQATSTNNVFVPIQKLKSPVLEVEREALLTTSSLIVPAVTDYFPYDPDRSSSSRYHDNDHYNGYNRRHGPYCYSPHHPSPLLIQQPLRNMMPATRTGPHSFTIGLENVMLPIPTNPPPHPPPPPPPHHPFSATASARRSRSHSRLNDDVANATTTTTHTRRRSLVRNVLVDLLKNPNHLRLWCEPVMMMRMRSQSGRDDYDSLILTSCGKRTRRKSRCSVHHRNHDDDDDDDLRSSSLSFTMSSTTHCPPAHENHHHHHHRDECGCSWMTMTTMEATTTSPLVPPFHCAMTRWIYAFYCAVRGVLGCPVTGHVLVQVMDDELPSSSPPPSSSLLVVEDSTHPPPQQQQQQPLSRLRVDIALGPFPGNMQLLMTLRVLFEEADGAIQMSSTTSDSADRRDGPSRVRIVNEVQLLRHYSVADGSTANPTRTMIRDSSSSTGSVWECVKSLLFQPTVENYMDQMLRSTARLRWLIEHGPLSSSSAVTTSSWIAAIPRHEDAFFAIRNDDDEGDGDGNDDPSGLRGNGNDDPSGLRAPLLVATTKRTREDALLSM